MRRFLRGLTRDERLIKALIPGGRRRVGESPAVGGRGIGGDRLPVGKVRAGLQSQEKIGRDGEGARHLENPDIIRTSMEREINQGYAIRARRRLINAGDQGLRAEFRAVIGSAPKSSSAWAAIGPPL